MAKDDATPTGPVSDTATDPTPQPGGDPQSPAVAPGTNATPDQPPVEPEESGVCAECFPAGPPTGYETVGCSHGSWTL